MRTAFPHALTVLVGLGMPRRIAGAGSALAFLDEQPASARDEAHEAATAACRDVFRDAGDVQEAFDIFAAYARRIGALVEDQLPPRPRRGEAGNAPAAGGIAAVASARPLRGAAR